MNGLLCRFSRPVRYVAAERLQVRLVEERIAGRIPDLVLLMQHPPVVTLGRRGRDQYLKVSPQDLQARGIDFAVAARGGDVTYHAPGQWVLYPVLRLDSALSGRRGYLCRLEEIAIRCAESFGVTAFRRAGLSGAWTDQGKIAAIGFRVRRWVTFHGLSFNVDLDLTGFGWMDPCGLVGEPVTSLRQILGDKCPDRERVGDVLHRVAGQVLGDPFSPWDQAGTEIRNRIKRLLEDELAGGQDAESSDISDSQA